MKGEHNKECNRKACINSPAIWYNHFTGKFVCGTCARIMNKRNKLEAQEKLGHDQCTLVKPTNER
jgi:hypothetical protein